MDVDDSSMVQITQDSFTDRGPNWSPDGRQIAFASNRHYLTKMGSGYDDFDIYVMNSSGAEMVQLTDSVYSDSAPSWSPNGRRIAFQSNRSGNSDIYVVNADGTEWVQITNSLANEITPAWSPDGSRIAFASDREGTFEIFSMGADGEDVIQLTGLGYNSASPMWQP